MSFSEIKSSLKGVLLKAVLILSFAGLFFGYSTGVISAVLFPILRLIKKEEQHQMVQSLIAASIVLGATLGSMFAGTFAEIFGKKKVMIFVSSLFAVGATLYLGFATSWIHMVIARTLQGISVGVYSSLAPSYLSEIAPIKTRGQFGIIFQFTITLSIFFGSVFTFINTTNSFHCMFGSAIFFAIPMLALSFWMSESPTYLISKGRKSEAIDILNTSFEEKETLKIIKEIESELIKEKTSWETVFSKEYRPHMILGVMMCVSQQFTGINAIIYYIQPILKNSNVTNIITLKSLSASVMLWNFITTVIAIMYIEKFGRRLMILIGMSIMGVALFISSFAFYIPSPVITSIFVIISIFIFIFGFEIGIGPLFWVVVNEIFPNSIRDRSASIITGLQWLCNLAFTFTFPYLENAIGGNVFGILFSINTLCILYFYFYLVKTKGLSFEEIQAKLKKRNAKELNES